MKFSISFPKDFLFGAATAAYQVEGGNSNTDWWEWESRNQKSKIKNEKLMEWPDYILQKYPNPLQEENYLSGQACDHYHRFREDFALAKSLGHTAHRLSIEWARIEPEEGRFDEKEIAHYREVLGALKAQGLTSFVGLHHFTNPRWFAAQGAWRNARAAEWFARYARKAAESFGDLVDFWITINEPLVFATSGYVYGVWPPQQRNLFAFFGVLRTIARSHTAAFRAMKQIVPQARVGMIVNNVYFHPLHAWFPPDQLVVAVAKELHNFRMLRAVRQSLDFIGLNYYMHSGISLLPPWVRKGKMIPSDFKWWAHNPEGIYHTLKDLSQFRVPLFVTENGIADARDAVRPRFIVEHLWWLHKAMQEGADVRGYLHWSLLDNFEWDSGFWPRFGLCEVDYRTLERRPRNSAYLFREIASAHAMSEGLMQRYAPDLISSVKK